MEGQLNQDDSILKVAVKTMKSEYVHTCGTPSPSLDPFPVPLRRQENKKVNSKLAPPQHLCVSRQEMKSMPGTSTEEI